MMFKQTHRTNPSADVGPRTSPEMEAELRDKRERLLLERTKLQTLVQEHSAQFEQHLKEHTELLREWNPIERELVVNKELYSTAASITQTDLSQLYTYDVFVQEQVLKQITALSFKAEFEASPMPYSAKAPTCCTSNSAVKKSNLHFQDLLSDQNDSYISNVESQTIPIAISRKTMQFLELEIPDEFPRHEASLLYLQLHEKAFQSQISQLPHFAALFFNDSIALAFHMYSLLEDYDQSSAENQNINVDSNTLKSTREHHHQSIQEHVKRCLALGKTVLLKFLRRMVDELHSTMSDPQHVDELWHSHQYFGRLSAEAISRISKVTNRALNRVAQVGRILAPMLDTSISVKIVQILLKEIQNWAWNGLMEQPNEVADKDALVASVLMPILQFSVSSRSGAQSPMLPALDSACTAVVDLRLEAAVRIANQSLMQASNAFRRDEFHDIMSLEELSSLVICFFPDSSMRKAFLAEIAAEL